MGQLPLIKCARQVEQQKRKNVDRKHVPPSLNTEITRKIPVRILGGGGGPQTYTNRRRRHQTHRTPTHGLRARQTYNPPINRKCTFFSVFWGCRINWERSRTLCEVVRLFVGACRTLWGIFRQICGRGAGKCRTTCDKLQKIGAPPRRTYETTPN